MDDGPGIRTTVFFKGCPLHCVWCHNPESIDPEIEIGFYPSDCIQCGDCAKVCPTGAAQINLPGRLNRTLCKRCGKCAEVCPGHGLRQIGRHYEIDEVLDIVLRDKVYYQTSGGGVTLSGGEPAFHVDYLSRLLRELKANSIHTTIETSGDFNWAKFETGILDWLDLILFDVKLVDPLLHLKFTGRRNDVIFQNLTHLIKARPYSIVPRIPLIPGLTTTQANLNAISSVLHDMTVKSCSLLPYNPMGSSKWTTIGKSMVNLPDRFLTKEELTGFSSFFPWAQVVEM